MFLHKLNLIVVRSLFSVNFYEDILSKEHQFSQKKKESCFKLVVGFIIKLIRIQIDEVSRIGRATQGVRVMNLGGTDRVVAVAKIVTEDEEEIVGEEDEAAVEAGSETESAQTESASVESPDSESLDAASPDAETSGASDGEED